MLRREACCGRADNHTSKLLILMILCRGKCGLFVETHAFKNAFDFVKYVVACLPVTRGIKNQMVSCDISCGLVDDHDGPLCDPISDF